MWQGGVRAAAGKGRPGVTGAAFPACSVCVSCDLKTHQQRHGAAGREAVVVVPSWGTLQASGGREGVGGENQATGSALTNGREGTVL